MNLRGKANGLLLFCLFPLCFMESPAAQAGSRIPPLGWPQIPDLSAANS